MWRIPTVVVPELIEAISQVDIVNIIFEAEQFLQLSIDKKTLYQRNVHLKSTCMASLNKSVMESQSLSVSTPVSHWVYMYSISSKNLAPLVI